MQIIGGIIFILIIFNPWIIPWIGDKTGITEHLLEKGLITGDVLNDFVIVILFIIFVPILLFLIPLIWNVILIVFDLDWTNPFREFYSRLKENLLKKRRC